MAFGIKFKLLKIVGDRRARNRKCVKETIRTEQNIKKMKKWWGRRRRRRRKPLN